MHLDESLDVVQPFFLTPPIHPHIFPHALTKLHQPLMTIIKINLEI